jgi:hypothetical protein
LLLHVLKLVCPASIVPDIQHALQLIVDATARVAAAVANAYEAVHCAVADTGSGYAGQPGFESALEHSPEHVRTILGVLG